MSRQARLRFLRYSVLAALIAFCVAPARSQEGGGAAPAAQDAEAQAIRELQAEVQQLRSELQQVRADAAHDRADAADLHRELDATRAQLNLIAADPKPAGEAQPAPAADPADPPEKASAAESMDELEQDLQLLTGKVNEQYQTKVESASKYRLRLSGMILVNLFDNRGSVDSMEDPTVALMQTPGSPARSLGGTLRQSEVGLEAFGPTVAGARSVANVAMDFAGGLAQLPGGLGMGVVRLRTATVGLDWGKTSILAGQDSLFFAPLAPTSFASLAVPAMAYAGNLWGWIPQIRAEHRISAFRGSTITLQGGILDPMAGQTPEDDYTRQPYPGEVSGQPALAGHVAWSHPFFGQLMSIGAGGYRSKQDWQYGRTVDSWLGSTDVLLPLQSWLELSGSFYRGSAVGGLGGGLGSSIVFNRRLVTDPTATVQGLDSMGGWAQLKVRPVPKFEVNTALGQDNPYAGEVRSFRWTDSYLDAVLLRNRSGMLNFIYRPRSDLVFSAEFRHIKSYPFRGLPDSANHVNLGIGVLF